MQDVMVEISLFWALFFGVMAAKIATKKGSDFDDRVNLVVSWGITTTLLWFVQMMVHSLLFGR